MANIHNEESPPEPFYNPVKLAFDCIKKEIQTDPSYAWSWHCNIAMAVYDEGVKHSIANLAAARFMEQCFGVNTTFPPVSPVESHKYTNPENVL